MATFIEQEFKYQDAPIKARKFQHKRTWKSILCSKFSKGVLIAFCIAVVLPTVAYYIVISRNVVHEAQDKYYCLIQEEFRVPCGPKNVSQTECERIDCCFNTTTEECHHFLPSKYFYTPLDKTTYTPSKKTTPFGKEALPNLQFSIVEHNGNQLSLIIHDSSQDKVSPASVPNKNFTINQSTKRLILEVLDSDGDAIFSTAKGALIASDYYWEWAFQLSNETIFGLDRDVIQMSENETLTKVIYKNKADHTTLPVFWAYQKGKFHGCVIEHDGPLEIQVLSSNIIILRSLLGKKIKVELTLGPTPQQLYQQQRPRKPELPPLWTMGTHNCRDGGTLKLKEILKIYAQNKDTSFDTDCFDKNLFMALQQPDVSEEDLTDFQTALKEMVTKSKFLLSLPPHIIRNESNPLFTGAQNQSILYQIQSAHVYNGSYLGQYVVYPDFSDKYIHDYYSKTLIPWIDEKFGLGNISGFVLNDNWPQDDSIDNVPREKFYYYSDEINKQMLYTLPWSLQGTDGRLLLETHNSYGYAQYDSLHSFLNKSTDLADLIIISSTKNFGDTELEISENFETSWDNFKMYLHKIMFNSITGNQMIGFPVCGDSNSYNKTLQETLCMRWYIAAATMPYFRIASGQPFRDPANLNSKFATNVAELAIKRRNWFLDYFYTILNKGEPLVRPMYYDYYKDTATFNLERQYTIGSELVIAHPFSNGKVKLQVYLPHEKQRWYEFWGGTMFAPQKKLGNIIEIDSLETDWSMFIAQGHIVALTDSNEINLFIALNCSPENVGCIATGELYKDSNTITYTATNSSVTLDNLPKECVYKLSYVKVYGYEGSTGYSHRYDINDKNKNLCNTTVTINYVQ